MFVEFLILVILIALLGQLVISLTILAELKHQSHQNVLKSKRAEEKWSETKKYREKVDKEGDTLLNPLSSLLGMMKPGPVNREGEMDMPPLTGHVDELDDKALDDICQDGICQDPTVLPSNSTVLEEIDIANNKKDN